MKTAEIINRLKNLNSRKQERKSAIEELLGALYSSKVVTRYYKEPSNGYGVRVDYLMNEDESIWPVNILPFLRASGILDCTIEQGKELYLLYETVIFENSIPAVFGKVKDDMVCSVYINMYDFGFFMDRLTPNMKDSRHADANYEALSRLFIEDLEKEKKRQKLLALSKLKTNFTSPFAREMIDKYS